MQEAELFEQLAKAEAWVRQRIALEPRVAVILGSGLGGSGLGGSGLGSSGRGGFAAAVEQAVRLPYSAIPHFPAVITEGHAGELVIGSVAGTPVAVMRGRVHGYEGYEPQQVTFPVRLLAALGIRTVVVTNAAGGIRLDLEPGELVLLADHINFTGTNPLTGVRDFRLGTRFCDMTHAYSGRLKLLMKKVAAEQGIRLAEGVYLGVSGPSFETPAEIRAFRAWGADLVGMSTVHEVIVARHVGMEVAGISCVTNMAAGVVDREIDHRDVIAIGERAQGELSRLLTRFLPLL